MQITLSPEDVEKLGNHIWASYKKQIFQTHLGNELYNNLDEIVGEAVKRHFPYEMYSKEFLEKMRQKFIDDAYTGIIGDAVSKEVRNALEGYALEQLVTRVVRETVASTIENLYTERD